MALDERIALSLYDKIYEVISGADPDAGLPSAFDSEHTMFTMAQRGMVLKAEDYRNPWTPGNTSGNIGATANIAQVVDDVPALNPVLSPTGRKVSEVYSKMVNGVHVTEPPPSEEMQQQRERLKKVLLEESKDDEGRPLLKPTQLADQEEKAFNAFQDAYSTYIATWAAAQADENLKRVWPMTGAQALQRPKRAFADWGASGRDQIASAKAQLATLNEGQVARAFADAQARLKAYELVSEVEMETFYRTAISPTDWASADGSGWPRFTMNESTFKSEFSTEATAWGGSANVNVGLWSFGGGVSHSDARQAMSQDTTNIGLSFSWRICPIRRPWLDATLFKLPNWDLGSFTGAGGVSGAPDPLMPLIPIALVIVRDVQIVADWSHQDEEHLQSATSGSASVGWGPFAVSGHYSHSSTSDKFAAQRSGDGMTIPDIQVLGYVCSKVPNCPPK